MPKLSSNVGKLGSNKKHDVALVQAMLRVIKNPKGQPYVTFGYDGTISVPGATFNAIKAFQEDHKTKAGPPVEQEGKIELNGKTFAKMVELLPASHKDIRSLENFPVVYLPGTPTEATQAAARVTSDPKFTSEFKGKLAALINSFYLQHGIVLSVNPDWANGGFRTFAEQRALMDRLDDDGDPVTRAGPGESNHNWGNGADVGFFHFRLLKGDGTVVRIPKVPGEGDGPWLSVLEKQDPAAAAALWKMRNDATSLFKSDLPKDMGHLQTFADNNISMGKSFAEHMSIEGCMWWEYKSDYRYWCNYGLADKNVKFKVGTAKRIWDRDVNVDETSLATALNQAIARRKVAALPDYEEAIFQAITELTPSPPSVWKATDIKSAHCNLMREFFLVDFAASEEAYTTWKPYKEDGTPL